MRTVYARARRIFVSSPALAAEASALRPYSDRISVIPFGIEQDAWGPTPARQERAAVLRQQGGDRPLILFTGRMVAYKGVDVLLRALARVDHARAVCAGDGPMRQTWIRLAAELGLASRVTFPGEVSREELAALYLAADLFVLPSVTAAEAFGFVQLEAMASGTPVISTRLASGVPWVNQDGITGLTVPPADADALARALVALLADDALRARMGHAARQRVADVFTQHAMGATASREFERLAQRAGTAA